jgi:hypothetical protein
VEQRRERRAPEERRREEEKRLRESRLGGQERPAGDSPGGEGIPSGNAPVLGGGAREEVLEGLEGCRLVPARNALIEDPGKRDADGQQETDDQEPAAESVIHVLGIRRDRG